MPSNDELNARMAEARAKILPTRTVQSADYAGGFMEAKRQALAHLAAVTRQRDELVEAVVNSGIYYGDAPELCDLVARIQAEQPKGEQPKGTRVLFACKDDQCGEEHFFPEIFRGNTGKAPDYIVVSGIRYEPVGEPLGERAVLALCNDHKPKEQHDEQ